MAGANTRLNEIPHLPREGEVRVGEKTYVFSIHYKIIKSEGAYRLHGTAYVKREDDTMWPYGPYSVINMSVMINDCNVEIDESMLLGQYDAFRSKLECAFRILEILRNSGISISHKTAEEVIRDLLAGGDGN